MDDLWKAIGDLATTMHADRIASVAEAVESLRGVSEFHRARAAFGPNIDQGRLERLISTWVAAPHVSPSEISAALRSAGQVSALMSHSEAIDLVWTGPETGLIPTRRTEQVLLEVIGSATNDLFLVTYVFYKAPSIIKALNDAICRGVRASVLLESSIERGGTVTEDSAGTIAEVVQGAKIYIWDPVARTQGGDALSASVHAKCAVADRKLAFITSANLTSAALERNMELGLLIRGGIVPDRLRSHLEALVTTKVIQQWSDRRS